MTAALPSVAVMTTTTPKRPTPLRPRRSSSACSAPSSRRWTCTPSTSATASATTGRSPAGPLTSAELAARTGTAERYAREWLEQQAVTGILDTDPEADARSTAATPCPPAHVAPLTDVLDLGHVAPVARATIGFVKQVDHLLRGLPHRRRGELGAARRGRPRGPGRAPTGRCSSARSAASTCRRSRTSTPPCGPAGRAADVGCGLGWSSIGIALAYPNATVDGYDVDAPSIEAARRNAREAGVDDRVHFHSLDAGTVARGDLRRRVRLRVRPRPGRPGRGARGDAPARRRRRRRSS